MHPAARPAPPGVMMGKGMPFPMFPGAFKGGFPMMGKGKGMGVPTTMAGGPVQPPFRPPMAGRGIPQRGLGTVLPQGSRLPVPANAARGAGKGAAATSAVKRPVPANAAQSAEKKFKPADEVLVLPPERCDNCCSKDHHWESCPQTWTCRICGEQFHTALFCHKSEAATLVVENMPSAPANELAELFKIFTKGTGIRIKGSTVGTGMVLAAGAPAFVVFADRQNAEEARSMLDKAILKGNVLKVDWARELEKQKKRERQQLQKLLGLHKAAEDAEEVDVDDAPETDGHNSTATTATTTTTTTTTTTAAATTTTTTNNNNHVPAKAPKKAAEPKKPTSTKKADSDDEPI